MLSKNIGVPASVLKGRAGPHQLDRAGPITPQVVADQQRIADTFHDLKLIPVPVQISEALCSPPA